MKGMSYPGTRTYRQVLFVCGYSIFLYTPLGGLELKGVAEYSS